MFSRLRRFRSTYIQLGRRSQSSRQLPKVNRTLTPENKALLAPRNVRCIQVLLFTLALLRRATSSLPFKLVATRTYDHCSSSCVRHEAWLPGTRRFA